MCLLLRLSLLRSEFSKERERARSKGAFKKQRDQQRLEEALNGYLEWITYAGKPFKEHVFAVDYCPVRLWQELCCLVPIYSNTRHWFLVDRF